MIIDGRNSRESSCVSEIILVELADGDSLPVCIANIYSASNRVLLITQHLLLPIGSGGSHLGAAAAIYNLWSMVKVAR